MKNYNLKPLYIFLAIFITAWFVKLTTKPKEIEGGEYFFKKSGKYINSFEENMHKIGEQNKREIEKIKRETPKDSTVVFPGYNFE
jgi:hypothetical protein